MLLTCTPTTQTRGGLTEQAVAFLVSGGFTAHTPQPFESVGGIIERTSTSGASVEGGFGEFATPNAFAFSREAGMSHIVTPTAQVRGGITEYTPRQFSSKAAMLLSAAPRITARAGYLARVAQEVSVSGGMLLRTPQSFETVAGLLLAMLPDEMPADLFSAWVLNISGGHSRYDNFPFTGLAQFGGKVLACSSEGLYCLDDDTDEGAPILASARTPLVDCGSDMQKRAMELYLTARSAGELTVTLAHDEVNQQEQFAPSTGMANLRQHRVVLGRSSDLDFNVVQAEITNPDGGDFEIAEMDITPVVASRRGR